MRRWLHVELNNGEEESAFRKFLHEQEIAYDSCGAFNLVHFSCLMNDDEAQLANEVLDRIDLARTGGETCS